jgi:hypothetical protein
MEFLDPCLSKYHSINIAVEKPSIDTPEKEGVCNYTG